MSIEACTQLQGFNDFYPEDTAVTQIVKVFRVDCDIASAHWFSCAVQQSCFLELTMRQSSPSTSRRPSRPSTLKGQSRRSTIHLQLQSNSNAVWKSPLLWLAILATTIVAGIPVVEWYRTVRVIAVLARDVSNSGLAEPTVGQNICLAQTQALKPGDVTIDIAYADTTEATRSSQVQSVTQMFPRCQDYVKQQRPETVGIRNGTSLLLLLERIQTQIQIQRKAGNTNPISALIWLQAAEPGPGLPTLNFDVLGERIKQITNDRGRVTIVGPTGELRQNIEKLSAQNPYLQVCSVAEHQACIRSTFDAARALPAKK